MLLFSIENLINKMGFLNDFSRKTLNIKYNKH